MKQVRLDKFISDHSEFSRSQIKNMAKKGEIKINGVTAKAPDIKIDPETQFVTAGGKNIFFRKNTYILLNKPDGYVSSTDPKDGRTVLELIPEELRNKNLFPAGRLDKDSLGALLITDDGSLAHRILSPKRHIPKIYIVKLAENFKIEYINKFEAGIILPDGEICLPAKVKQAENNVELAFIQLYEGKFHQVKRMFAAVGNHVEKLMRVSVGGLVLPEKLGIGQCMELLHKDVENLFTSPNFDIFCHDFDTVFSALLINNLL